VQMAFVQYRDATDAVDSFGIYLLSDGKPDTSMSLVMNKVAEMNAGRNVVINTISFNCPDRYRWATLLVLLVHLSICLSVLYWLLNYKQKRQRQIGTDVNVSLLGQE